MGEEYRARDNRLNRDLAVKVLQPPVAETRTYPGRWPATAPGPYFCRRRDIMPGY